MERKLRFNFALISCFNVLQRITSGIVFSQFAGTILIMCTSLFQITRVN